MFSARILPNAISILKERYPYLTDDFQGFINLKKYLGEEVLVTTLDFTKDHSIYNSNGSRLIKNIAIKVVSLKTKKSLAEYL